MRIGLPENTLQAYVPPVPVVPLSKEASKALIVSGVFAQKPDHVAWTTPGQAPLTLGGPMGAVVSGNVATGLTFHPRTLPRSDDSLLTVLADVAKQILPSIEHGETHGVADGFALLAAAPETIEALTNPHQRKTEKFILLGTSLVNVLSIANQFVPVPHADTALTVVAGIFKVGEQVFITGANQSTAG